MSETGRFTELTEAELTFTLEIILRSDSKAIPVMKGQGSSKDCTVRDIQMQVFARHLAKRLRMHVKCVRSPPEPLHSIG